MTPNKLNKTKHIPNKFKRESKTKNPSKSKAVTNCKLTQTQLDFKTNGIRLKKEMIMSSSGQKLCLKQEEQTDGSCK